MKTGAERTVFADYLGATAAPIYVFNGQPKSFCRVLRMRFTNTSAGAAVVSVLIVPNGGGINDVRYSEVLSISLAAVGADRSILEYEPESETAGIKLRNGESIIAWASPVNTVAARVEIEDVMT